MHMHGIIFVACMNDGTQCEHRCFAHTQPNFEQVKTELKVQTVILSFEVCDIELKY